MYLLGVGDGAEQPGCIRLPFLLRRVGKRQIAHVRLRFPSERRLQVTFRHWMHI